MKIKFTDSQRNFIVCFKEKNDSFHVAKRVSDSITLIFVYNDTLIYLLIFVKLPPTIIIMNVERTLK